MKPTDTKPTSVSWWTRGAESPYDGPTPSSLRTAVSEHPHWAEARMPGRAVRRQIARRGGDLRPRPVRKYRRRTGPIGRYFNSGTHLPLVPSFVQQFIGRTGGDR
ncbi:hypothetical protein EFK50_16585 [Nocardioides marmoriginsengisoli]|uniref:Uncharacterized protein n=1 Tax=Nocardioides marmoriginsengisoli TaxID=661483 RepID=A0A3N0CDD1_9ACTN|nr:hypothetical protein [Nocardioides marmoriginsengisoli]RNL61003.1 hypothetical protein EFK50_16585 [Nocardioides marmoriginsengisoli]